MKQSKTDRATVSPDSQFVEDMGITLESMGLPRISGRLLGWLLVCDPPEQSAGELGEALGASAGSISTNVRMLERNGLVTRVGVPGSRRAHYRLPPNAWSSMIHEQMGLMRHWRDLAEDGLALLTDRPAAQRHRLEEMNEFLTHMNAAMATAFDTYHQDKETTRG